MSHSNWYLGRKFLPHKPRAVCRLLTYVFVFLTVSIMCAKCDAMSVARGPPIVAQSTLFYPSVFFMILAHTPTPSILVTHNRGMHPGRLLLGVGVPCRHCRARARVAR